MRHLSTWSVARCASILAIAAVCLLPARALRAYVVSQPFTCPLCGTRSMGPVVVSELRLGMGLDLEPVGSDASPHPLPVCPKDHFVLYKKGFTKDEVARMRVLVRTADYRAAIKEGSTYLLLAKIREHEQAKPDEIAFHLLKASWEVEGDSVKWQRCAEACLTWYEKVLSSRPRTAPVDAADLLWVELPRRLGRFDTAQRNLDSLFARLSQPDSLMRYVLEYERKLILEADRFPHEIQRQD